MKWFSIIVMIIFFAINCAKEPNSCGEDKVTYDTHIKTIFERACNNESCHPGSIDGWAVLPFFDSYDKILPFLENSKIKDRVFSQDTQLMMPPLNFEERFLSVEERDLLACWLEVGFPEN